MKNLFNRIGFAQCLLIALAVTLTMMPDLAAAAGSSGIFKALCGGLNLIASDVAKGIATLAVVIVGFAALLGRVQWGMAIIVGIGIGVIFGAGPIVGALGGSGSATSQC